MEKAQMIYREAAPSDDLARYILSFWELSVPADNLEYEIFPDGCSSLFYLHNIARRLTVVGVSGLQLETIKRPIFAGDVFWGMRLSPAACSAILRDDPANLLRILEPKTPAELPHLADGLTDHLAAAKTFEQAVAIYETRMRKLIAEGCLFDPVVAEAVRSMAVAPGQVRVEQLAEALGLSTRQFQRRFRASSGLTPKQFLRTQRIRATAVNLVKNRDQKWAERAAELGFADQAHMTHEFVSITNRSPKSFAESLSDISHGELVK